MLLIPILMAAATTFRGVVVVHHSTGAEERVSAALVVLDDVRTAVTAIDGTFAIDGVPSGWHDVEIASNFAALDSSIFIPPFAEVRRLVLSDPGCAVWSGIVRDEESGRPLSRAAFLFLGLDARTDRSGFWIFTWGCGPHSPGHNTFLYYFSAPGYLPLSIIGGRAENFVPYPRLFDVSLQPDGTRITTRPDYNPRP